jgi:hypothetical protein
VRLSHRFFRPALALGLSLQPPLLAAGCAEQTPHILLGQPYATGNQAYDDFFKAVIALHAEAQRAEADERATHDALISALGLDPKTSTQMTVSEARQRAKKLRDGGLLLHLEITPETKVVTKKETRDASLTSTTKDLLKAVEDSTRSALALTTRVSGIAARAAELEKTRADLRAQAPAKFSAEEAKRDEITQELDAAAKVLTETSELSNRYAGLSAKFVIDLAHALEFGDDVEAGADGGKGADARPAAKRPPSRPPSGAAGPRPPPAGKPPPAAGPKNPKGGDDFEP